MICPGAGSLRKGVGLASLRMPEGSKVLTCLYRVPKTPSKSVRLWTKFCPPTTSGGSCWPLRPLAFGRLQVPGLRPNSGLGLCCKLGPSVWKSLCRDQEKPGRDVACLCLRKVFGARSEFPVPDALDTTAQCVLALNAFSLQGMRVKSGQVCILLDVITSRTARQGRCMSPC